MQRRDATTQLRRGASPALQVQTRACFCSAPWRLDRRQQRRQLRVWVGPRFRRQQNCRLLPCQPRVCPRKLRHA